MRMLSRVLLRVVPFAAMASIVIAGQAPPPTGAGGTTQPAETQPPAGRAGGPQGTPPAPARGGGGMLAGAGPADKPPVDAGAADRGRTVYGAECVSCHGPQARGTQNGSNLVRSLVVLRDRYGSQIGPLLKQGHKEMMSGRSSTTLTDAQIVDLANFLRQRVNDTLRGSPIFQVQNVLTGDAKAGAAFFNGEGKCSGCHSPTGNLAGIGSRLQPVDIQQRFLFPGSGRGGRGRGPGAPPPATPSATAVTVTLTPPSGPALSGTLLHMDDFTVSLRDASGQIRTLSRTPDLKVVKTNPLAAHRALLDTITDKNMHDVVAYLETLK
jgi:cytochrome c oxidase cbb3-type subunit III